MGRGSTAEGETRISVGPVRPFRRDTSRIESIKLPLSLTYKNTYGFTQTRPMKISKSALVGLDNRFGAVSYDIRNSLRARCRMILSR